MRQALARAIQSACHTDTCMGQPIPGLTVYRCRSGVDRCPMVYQPSICLIGQGRKRLYLGDRCYPYDANSYLIGSLTLPVEVEVELGDGGEDFLGLRLHIDRAVVRQVILDMQVADPNFVILNQADTIQQSPLPDRLLDAVVRLLQTIDDPVAKEVLAPSLWREIYFEVLRGPHGSLLHHVVDSDVDTSRLAPVFNHINENFDQKLDVDTLAALANMSSSTLHNHFKQMTALSPIQYVKNIRLHRAHSKILAGSAINQACYEVGYHSPSQFSREFKRFFGVSPSELAQPDFPATAYTP